MSPACHSCYPYVTIFIIKKAKMAKNVLDQKAFAVGKPAAALML